ncbi:DUF2059 domain-containing protein [Coralloluteibacterium thermophilus]|uniref:DUF2059 domain-containing protein n=1 Tax=Coralloluteibacterium thermophilum TaxID=2707049 RepID=A0ABV9NRE3_9GAMM
MTRWILAVLLSIGPGVPGAVGSDLASRESVYELLELTEARNLLDSTMAQMEGYLEAATAQALAGREPSVDEKAILKAQHARLLQVFGEIMSWEALEPLYVEMYEETFTQEEIEGLLEFYRSDLGRAMVTKMPGLMHRTVSLVQERMAAAQPRLQEMQAEMMKDISRMLELRNAPPVLQQD